MEAATIVLGDCLDIERARETMILIFMMMWPMVLGKSDRFDCHVCFWYMWRSVKE